MTKKVTVIYTQTLGWMYADVFVVLSCLHIIPTMFPVTCSFTTTFSTFTRDLLLFCAIGHIFRLLSSEFASFTQNGQRTAV